RYINVRLFATAHTKTMVRRYTFGRIRKSRGLVHGRRNPKGSGTGAEHCPGGGGEAARSSAEPLRVCQTGVEKSSERRGQGDSFSANGRMASRQRIRPLGAADAD